MSNLLDLTRARILGTLTQFQDRVTEAQSDPVNLGPAPVDGSAAAAELRRITAPTRTLRRLAPPPLQIKSEITTDSARLKILIEVPVIAEGVITNVRAIVEEERTRGPHGRTNVRTHFLRPYAVEERGNIGFHFHIDLPVARAETDTRGLFIASSGYESVHFGVRRFNGEWKFQSERRNPHGAPEVPKSLAVNSRQIREIIFKESPVPKPRSEPKTQIVKPAPPSLAPTLPQPVEAFKEPVMAERPLLPVPVLSSISHSFWIGNDLEISGDAILADGMPQSSTAHISYLGHVVSLRAVEVKGTDIRIAFSLPSLLDQPQKVVIHLECKDGKILLDADKQAKILARIHRIRFQEVAVFKKQMGAILETGPAFIRDIDLFMRSRIDALGDLLSEGSSQMRFIAQFPGGAALQQAWQSFCDRTRSIRQKLEQSQAGLQESIDAIWSADGQFEEAYENLNATSAFYREWKEKFVRFLADKNSTVVSRLEEQEQVRIQQTALGARIDEILGSDSSDGLTELDADGTLLEARSVEIDAALADLEQLERTNRENLSKIVGILKEWDEKLKARSVIFGKTLSAHGKRVQDSRAEVAAALLEIERVKKDYDAWQERLDAIAEETLYPQPTAKSQPPHPLQQFLLKTPPYYSITGASETQVYPTPEGKILVSGSTLAIQHNAKRTLEGYDYIDIPMNPTPGLPDLMLRIALPPLEWEVARSDKSTGKPNTLTTQKPKTRRFFIYEAGHPERLWHVPDSKLMPPEALAVQVFRARKGNNFLFASSISQDTIQVDWPMGDQSSPPSLIQLRERSAATDLPLRALPGSMPVYYYKSDSTERWFTLSRYGAAGWAFIESTASQVAYVLDWAMENGQVELQNALPLVQKASTSTERTFGSKLGSPIITREAHVPLSNDWNQGFTSLFPHPDHRTASAVTVTHKGKTIPCYRIFTNVGYQVFFPKEGDTAFLEFENTFQEHFILPVPIGGLNEEWRSYRALNSFKPTGPIVESGPGIRHRSYQTNSGERIELSGRLKKHIDGPPLLSDLLFNVRLGSVDESGQVSNESTLVPYFFPGIGSVLLTTSDGKRNFILEHSEGEDMILEFSSQWGALDNWGVRTVKQQALDAYHQTTATRLWSKGIAARLTQAEEMTVAVEAAHAISGEPHSSPSGNTSPNESGMLLYLGDSLPNAKNQMQLGRVTLIQNVSAAPKPELHLNTVPHSHLGTPFRNAKRRNIRHSPAPMRRKSAQRALAARRIQAQRVSRIRGQALALIQRTSIASRSGMFRGPSLLVRR